MGAVFVTAFVDRDFGPTFPEEQGAVAIGAAIFRGMFKAGF